MIEKLKGCLIVLFLLFPVTCYLSPALHAQQPTSAAPVFLANSKYLQGRTWADYKPSAGAGLTLNIAAGTAYCGNPPVPVFYAGGTLTLTASQTNYVYLDPTATCAPAFNITGFAVGQIPLAKVVTGPSTITSVTDVRTWFVDPNSLGPVIRADLMPGADAGAKIAAAIAVLPSTGGTVDARGLPPTQTWATNPFAGTTKIVTFLLGPATITANQPITLPSLARLIGAGGRGGPGYLTAPGATRIIGAHTGAAVLNLTGTYGVKIEGISLHGDITTTPKTGITLGRLDANSAGSHTFRDVEVSGYFTTAGIYSIASEDNRWYDTAIILNGGGALYPLYTSQTDLLGVGGLFGSSNIDTKWFGLMIVSYVNNAAASLIFIDAGKATKSHSFLGGYLAGIDGSYVTIRNFEVDNDNTPGPITFIDVSGERASGVLMQNGFNILGTGVVSLSGLAIINSVFPTAAGGKFINQGAWVTLKDSFIKVPANNNGSTWQTAQIFNTYIDEGEGTNIKQYGGFDARRFKTNLATALAAGDFALSAGWGTTAAVSAVTGTDQGWNITVTCGGTGIAANPTITLTFKDGTWTNTPIVISKMVGGTGTITDLTEPPADQTPTTWKITFNGTPVDTKTYIISGIVMGR